MKLNSQHILKAVLLGLFALFFVNLQMTGDISKYINPKYDFMSKLAAIIFSILFLIQLPRIFRKRHVHHICSTNCSHEHADSRWSLRKISGFAVIAFPVMTGFTIPPATLDSSIAANKGSVLTQISGGQKEQKSPSEFLVPSESLAEKENIDIYSSEHIPLINNNYLSEEELEKKAGVLEEAEIIKMDSDIFSSYYAKINNNPRYYEGRTIKMSGFVFKEGEFAGNQLVLSRFLITHCVADASVIGFLTELEGADTLEQDTWVEIEGVISAGSYDEYELPIVKVSSWSVIDEPSEPYIFPILTLLE
ncbi:TIGR03943 family putative permease subunit [Solibacillus silvestris]|uniref:TIGR03943 family putative permease subunit n=1 Tax=Solibacillus silvestris TaxID=76853 RepID=UPI003F7F27A3